MIRKIIIYLSLLFFSTTVVAEELFMQCGESRYKYVMDPNGDKVFWKHKKGTKNKYQEWCQETPVGKQISKEGWTRIIKDKKAICMSKKVTYPNNIEVTNSISVNDYVKLTRQLEWYHTKTGDKKNTKTVKCKKRKK